MQFSKPFIMSLANPVGWNVTQDLFQLIYFFHWTLTVYILITISNDNKFFHGCIFIVAHIIISYDIKTQRLSIKHLMRCIPFIKDNNHPNLETTLTFSVLILLNSIGFFCNKCIMSNWYCVLSCITAIIFVEFVFYKGLDQEVLCQLNLYKLYPETIKWYIITQTIRAIFMLCVLKLQFFNISFLHYMIMLIVHIIYITRC
eukprot:447914_1